MNLSVMLFPFHARLSDGTLTSARMIKILRGERITAIEPMMSWIEADPAKWSEFDRAARDGGMTYCCYDIGVNLVGENEKDRTTAVDLVERGVDFCRNELDCPIVMLAGSNAAENMTNDEGRKFYGETLARCYERTRGSGVTLTIENFGVYPNFTAGAAHNLEVLETANYPEIMFAFDNGNFLLGDDEPTHAYGLLQDRTAHLHIKDFSLTDPDDKRSLPSPSGKRYVACPLGNGDGEVAEILDLFSKSQYNGWISLEVHGSDDPLAAAVHGARFVWNEEDSREYESAQN